MMGQPKPFASLSSGLLARKGQARPAMRPQGFGGFGSLNGAMDDLGWNDMGSAETAAPVHPIDVDQPLPAPTVPPVLVDRAALAEEFDAADEAYTAVDEPAPVIKQLSTPKRGKAAKAAKAAPSKPIVKVAIAPKGKAAFTLRLDADRHLRLRLASALRNQSAQQLVTAALDALLAQMPEVEALAEQAAHRNDQDA